ncbi:hypothetical protein ACFSGX_12295 [Sphingomonas arantia]|uniref:Lipoprotein n=1 Tax=Sphingomonas arantia TaxID=1460676 RepID=A0ABW4TXT9_9SPHN
MILVLGGCATTTPNLRNGSQTLRDETLSEQHLIYHIQCQLASAVHQAVAFDKLNAHKPPELRAKWLSEWGAKISLVLSVNNKNAFAPGLTLNHPLANAVTVFGSGDVTTAQNRSVGLGFTWSADATRTETIGFFYSFKELLESPIKPELCEPSIGPYLSSDLKIAEFLLKGVDISMQNGAVTRKAGESPYETFTYQVKFIVTTGGNITPAWKLVELTANQSGNLFAASRIHTDDLTITMGKVKEDVAGKATPLKSLDDQHLANLIGQAVANSLQGRPSQ